MVERIKPLLLYSDCDNKQWVANALKEISMDFIEADSIKAAERIPSNQYNLILLGLALEECQGMVCLERVKVLFPNIGVIVVVSAGEEKLVEVGVENDAQGFIQVGTLGSNSIGTLIQLAFKRQNTINQINQSRTQLSNLIANLPGFIYRCLNDEEWTMEYLSDSVTRITGYTPAQLMHNREIAYQDIIHPDDRAYVHRKIKEAIEKGNRYQLDYRIITTNKVERWVWEQGNAISSDKGSTILEGYVTDNTDKKIREIQIQAIIETGNILKNALRLNDFCQELISKVREIFKADCAALLMPTSRERIAVIQFVEGRWEELQGEEVPLPEGLGLASLQDGKISLFNHEDSDREMEPIFEGKVSRFMACLPLFIDPDQTGLLVLGREYQFNEAELETMIAISDMLIPAIERANLLKKVESQLKHLESLHAIDQAITSNFDLQVVNKIILDQVCKELNGDAADILILNKATNILENLGTTGFMDPMIRNIRVPLTTSVAGKVLLENKRISIYNLEENPLWFVRKNMQVENFKSFFAYPMVIKGETIGVMEVYMRKVFYPDRDWDVFLEALATQAAVAYDSFKKYSELQRMQQNTSASFRSTLETWSKSLEMHDLESEGHIRRVTNDTIRLARALGMDEGKLPDIERGALLHDIGKIGIMDEILLKKGDLTDEDWKEIKRHPQIARDLLSNVKLLEDAMDIPYSHHENWDGSGYPQGLKGEEIPLPARIFAVVDTFDAMTSPRPYRNAWTKTEAIHYLIEQKGKKFDPQVVDLFIDQLK
jgi:PAS domain S-box-containing protein